MVKPVVVLLPCAPVSFIVASMRPERMTQVSTYKTKLKLDKEVGGGDLSDLCTITYLIAYPYA